MQTRRSPAVVLSITLGLASFACSNAEGGGPSPSPAVCESCTEILSDSALKPAAVAADADFVYVLKSQTSEIVAASFETKQSRVLSDSVAHATWFFLRGGTLWVTAYDSGITSLWTVDTATGRTSALPDLPGLFSVRLGPNGTPVAAVETNDLLRIVALADDGTIANVLWQLEQPHGYFTDFAASPGGVAWVASTSTTDTLYFASDLVTPPVSADARPAVSKVGTLTLAAGTASLVASTDNIGNVYTLIDGKVAQQAPLPWQSMGMQTLENALLLTSLVGLDVSALDVNGKVFASQTLTRPLNIPASADSRYVYLPLKDALAIFPRVGKWL
jgi:hypothetical protein